MNKNVNKNVNKDVKKVLWITRESTTKNEIKMSPMEKFLAMYSSYSIPFRVTK